MSSHVSMKAALLLFLSMGSSFATLPPNAVVAPDGSGSFKTVQAAIDAVPQTTTAAEPWVILIKPGTYKELIYIQREKRFVRLIGEEAATTTLTFNIHAKMIGLDGREIGTFRTPSTVIDADDFTAEKLTFENSAGPVGQALAVRLDGDRIAFRDCRFLGSQDTLLANRGRHYFERCTIAGRVDFIFGGTTAFFEKCEIKCTGDGYLTAASTPDDQPFGFVFSHCRITGASPEMRAYLGRPWRPYASTVFLHTEMPEIIRAAGWSNWNKPEREKTTRYAEFESTGPGGAAGQRVPWAQQLSAAEAGTITIERVLGGRDHWDPVRQLAR